MVQVRRRALIDFYHFIGIRLNGNFSTEINILLAIVLEAEQEDKDRKFVYGARENHSIHLNHKIGIQLL